MAAETSLIFPLVPMCTTWSSPAKPKLVISRSRLASSSSLVTIAPPSKELRNLVAWKLRTSASPKPPTIRPPLDAPKACAAS